MIANEGEVAATAHAQADAEGLQTPGALLQRERERLGLSVQQAAEGLHLDPWIVEAMEANRFLALGAPVYAKGHLRKYAALLGLAPELILSRYEALSDAPQEPTPVPVITTTPPPRPKWPKYIGWSFVAVVVLGVAFVAIRDLWPELDLSSTSVRPSAAPLQETSPSALPIEAGEAAVTESREELPGSSAPETEPATVTEAREPVAGDATIETTSSESANVRTTESAAAPATVAAGEQMSVRLDFGDASWVEIYDATGQRLFYDIGRPGRSRTVVGTPPITVVLGVASAVSLQVNGKPVVVPRRANRDSTRFVIDADGSIR